MRLLLYGVAVCIVLPYRSIPLDWLKLRGICPVLGNDWPKSVLCAHASTHQRPSTNQGLQLQPTAALAIEIGLRAISHRFDQHLDWKYLRISRLGVSWLEGHWTGMSFALQKTHKHLPKWQEEPITQQRTFLTVHIKVFCRIERKRAGSAPCAKRAFRPVP